MGKEFYLQKAQGHVMSSIWNVQMVNNTRICSANQGRWGLGRCLPTLGLRIMKAWVIGVKALPAEPLSSFLTKDFDFYKI